MLFILKTVEIERFGQIWNPLGRMVLRTSPLGPLTTCNFSEFRLPSCCLSQTVRDTVILGKFRPHWVMRSTSLMSMNNFEFS